MKTEKEFNYAQKLSFHIMEIFEEDSNNFIDKNELLDDKNATAFIHALANLMPNIIYQKLTNDTPDTLEFNHIANRLAFQFSNKK